MKRLLLLLPVLAVLLMAAPAGAHSVPDTTVTVTCDTVTFEWTNFPAEQSVLIHVVVLQNDEQTTASVETQGAADGQASVPVALTENGLVSVEFVWSFDENTYESYSYRTLDCTPVEPPPTTTPPTTEPPTTTPVTEPTTVVEPTTALIPAVSVPPAELANTGANTVGLVVGGWLLLSVGVALLFGNRTRRSES